MFSFCLAQLLSKMCEEKEGLLSFNALLELLETFLPLIRWFAFFIWLRNVDFKLNASISLWLFQITYIY